MTAADTRFEGFESRPDLIPIVREMFHSIQGDFGAFQEQVSAIFELKHGAGDCPYLWLTLRLNLRELTEEHSAVVKWPDVEQSSNFRLWVRGVWARLLDKLLDKRAREVVSELAMASEG